MNEQQKLEEAEFFLKKLVASREDPKVFVYYLSAFMAAARSPLQYALEEAKPQTGGQAWYEACLTNEVRFFRDERNSSIHTVPVAPTRHVHLTAHVFAQVSESVTAVITKLDGTVERVIEVPERAHPPRQSPFTTVTDHYFFNNWPEKIDVVDLCARYLGQVHKIVSDGRKRGYLTHP